MKNFEIVKKNFEIVNGFTKDVDTMEGFNFVAGTLNYDEELKNEYLTVKGINAWEDLVDSYKEGDMNYLCQDENGDFYSVLFKGEKPFIWCRVQTFAEQINDAISSTGLKLTVIAKKIGVPYRTIQKWKLGDRTPSRFVQLEVISKISEIK